MVECSKTTDILDFQVSYTKLTQNPVVSRTIPTKALLYNRPFACIGRSAVDVGCGPVIRLEGLTQISVDLTESLPYTVVYADRKALFSSASTMSSVFGFAVLFRFPRRALPTSL